MTENKNGDEATLADAIEKAEQQIDQLPEHSVDDQIKLSRASTEDKVRTYTTKFVVCSYVSWSIGIGLISGIGFLLYPDKAWATLLESQLDLIAKIGLPISMLVLGYYFGSASK